MNRAPSMSISGSYVRTTTTPRAVAVMLAPAGAQVLVAAIVGAALVTASLVFLVWVKMSQVQTGYDIHRRQSELVKLRQEKNALEVEVSALRRPDRLADLGRKRLGLEAPRPDQVLILPSSPRGVK